MVRTIFKNKIFQGFFSKHGQDKSLCPYMFRRPWNYNFDPSLLSEVSKRNNFYQTKSCYLQGEEEEDEDYDEEGDGNGMYDDADEVGNNGDNNGEPMEES